MRRRQSCSRPFSSPSPKCRASWTRQLRAITPVLYARFVEGIYELIGPDEEMAEFPDARFVLDATFQETWTPLGTYDERKRFFSGKHKGYGLKSQTLHNRRGFLL